MDDELIERLEGMVARRRISSPKEAPMVDPVDIETLAGRVERGEIRALSIKQPYPHHIFHDGKDVENRDWRTNGRGWVIVHAGRSTDGPLPKSLVDLPRGGVVGMMKIVDCVDQSDSEWFFGRYGFVINESLPLPLISCKGALGFFALPTDVNKQVAAALRARLVQQQGVD